jgi:hypothetical protein
MHIDPNIGIEIVKIIHRQMIAEAKCLRQVSIYRRSIPTKSGSFPFINRIARGFSLKPDLGGKLRDDPNMKVDFDCPGIPALVDTC